MDTQNYINHIGFVIDNSSSMSGREREVVRVTDSQVQYLAQRSKDLDQETRATTYLFDDTVSCIHYDKDVLRLPSLSKHYRPQNMTALVDATLKCIEDLEKTPELYGDHAFLIFVITDGQENKSIRRYTELTNKLSRLPNHWTIAVLVPDQRGLFEAKKFGFPAQNISIWDATSTQGFAEAGRTIQKATDQWMENRSRGVRGSTNLFQLDVSKLSTVTINNVLQQLNSNDYEILPIYKDGYIIRPFVEMMTGQYRTGSAYYQITKSETIQAGKAICVMDKLNGRVYTGPEARNLLGLPNYDTRVKPSDHDRYDIFVQSTSVNRKLVNGTKLLIRK